MRPTEHLLNVLRSLLGKSYAGLVVPERFAYVSLLIQSFVDNIPRKNLPCVVSHYASDVFVEKPRELLGCEVTLRQPIRVVVVPDQAMAPNLHLMDLRKANQFAKWLTMSETATSSALRKS